MNHERLRCYRTLVEAAARIRALIKKWPRGYGYLANQIQRAIASAVLNLAEGSARQGSQKERYRFFEIALGSISEVCACLDLCSAYSLIPPEAEIELKTLLKDSYCGVKRLP